MQSALLILAPIALLGVALVLAKGLYHFTQEGDEARRSSNRMMRWRIALQFVAVILLLAVVAISGG
ncbi:MAG: twin transmembrane helix small protein [Pseudomonadota bacterium]